MRQRQLKFIIGMAIIFLLTAVCSSERQEGGDQTVSSDSPKTSNTVMPALTAGECIVIAHAAAIERAPDAFLVHVDSAQRSASPDGRSEMWEIRYYSSTKDDEFVVIMDGGKVRKVRTSTGGYRKRIPEGWMDSDKAAQRIQETCVGAPGETYFFMLLATADGQSAKWGISCGGVENRRYIMVDAFSGEILSVKDSW